MILVDSSVWVEFFSHHPSTVKSRLQMLLDRPREISICGIILQEVLQGIDDEPRFHQVRSLLLKLPYFPATRESYLHAVTLSRQIRRRGAVIHTGDALIAAIALEQDMILFTLDSDFSPIAHYAGLQLFHG